MRTARAELDDAPLRRHEMQHAACRGRLAGRRTIRIGVVLDSLATQLLDGLTCQTGGRLCRIDLRAQGQVELAGIHAD